VFLDATDLNITMPLIDPVTMASPSPSKNTVTTKTSLPVELLPTDLARIVSQVHPALLLSAYYLRFPALVADPVSTLLNSLLPLATIQIAYAVICLPAVGSTLKPVKKAKPGSKKIPEPSTARGLVGCTPLINIYQD
jgi:GPI ethanolamine phosphate transferase 2/3 subunit F